MDTNNNQPIVSARGLVKTFGNLRALDGLDLKVTSGEVHGFLGPNGAGKSTTIRILLGLLRKNGGSVELFGDNPWTDRVRLHRRLAYVPGDVNLWPNLSGGEVIDLLGALRGGIQKKRRNELVEAFKLDVTKKCNTYSKGNRQKVAIIAALASDVELYILDEPTSGLDPLMQAIFNTEIARLKKAGKTVLLSSHLLSEVDTLCDRVTIIKEGKAIESGTLTELRRLTRNTVVVETKKPITKLGSIPGVTDTRLDDTRAEFKVEAGSMDALLQKLIPLGIISLTSTPPSLEELFLRHYRSK
ncbi:MAG TPA: ABC transporter ATP-binding protein [Candidatus Saccharimonadales bacterium]